MKRAICCLCLVLSIGFSGCARILLPYHESFLCNKGQGTGYCGSLRQVYQATLEKNTNEQNSIAVPLKGGRCKCGK